MDALASMIKFGHIGGAAVDVFPEEPAKNGSFEVGPLRGLKNVILTPHVGGSTEEAQVKIAEEVASKMIHGIENGSSTMSINLPELELPEAAKNTHRILHLHRNVPGVVMELNRAVASLGMNVVSQVSCGRRVGRAAKELKERERKRGRESSENVSARRFVS